jgi:lysophospholipase L1-like esterase
MVKILHGIFVLSLVFAFIHASNFLHARKAVSLHGDGIPGSTINNKERPQTDWANLKKYTADNERLKSMSTEEERVVFMGNSITELWKTTDSSFFAGKPYINRGISGQTTPQMLVRFREDVIELKPKIAVILAGINDIAENTGPATLENIFGNIVSMVELAKANHIKVILCSVLPAKDFPWRHGLEPAEKVVKLNAMIKSYADKNDIAYVDYHSSMVDERKGLKAELSDDGVHPTLAGYKVMGPLVEKAIAQALKSK